MPLRRHVYCEKQHTLADCHKIRNQPYEERVDFLKENVQIRLDSLLSVFKTYNEIQKRGGNV